MVTEQEKLAGAIEAEELQAGYAVTQQAQPSGQFQPQPDWQVSETTAQGEPAIYKDPQGVDHYSPTSTMWDLGYKTSKEYAKTGALSPNPKTAAPWVATRTVEGEPIHIAKTDITKLAEKSGQDLFQSQVQLGLVPKGSIYVGEGRVILPGQVEKIAKETPQLLKVLKDDGYNAYINAINILNKTGATRAAAIEAEELQAGYAVKPGKGEAPEIAESVKEAKLNLLQTIWRGMTPWEEAKGETFLQFIKETPRRLVEPEIQSQAELKSQYETEQASPLWARLLFGPTVAYDKKADKYYPIVATEAPMVGPAREAKIAAKAAKPLVKTIEVNWNKLISPKVNKPQINWNELVKAIERGKVKKAEEAEQWAKQWAESQARKISAPRPSTPAQVIEQRRFTQKGMEDAFKAAQKVRMQEWNPASRFLTKIGMQKLLGQYETMRPTEAIKYALKNNMLVAAVAANPKEIYDILFKTSGKVRADALKSLGNIGESLNAGNISQAKAQAINKLETQAKVETLLSQATEQASKAKSEGKTETETQTTTELQVKGLVENLPDTKLKEQLATHTKQIAQTAIDVAATKPIITPMYSGGIGLTTPPEVKKPPKVILPKLSETEEEKRERIRQSPGTVAWNMGKLHGKDVWHIRLPNGKRLVILGPAPQGARILADGPGSASKTTQTIGGPLRQVIEQRHGAVKITITPSGTTKGAEARFTPLAKLRSVRKGKQFFTKMAGGVAISRHPLGRHRRRNA